MAIPEKIKILYVDDEKNNLIAFQSYFRKEYEVYTATTVVDALLKLENENMHIIISDQRMPTTTGVEFLEQTIAKHPDSIRMLITGQSDINVVIQAINRGQITKFVQKPWDWEKLSLAIENCVLLYKSKIELKEKNSELQKANDELNKFVYSVSHDLRSPLMSILGIVHLAKMSKDGPPDGKYFEMIETCVVKLDTFIKNIIDYYKNSRADEIVEPVDFRQLSDGVIETLKNQDPSVEFESQVEQSGEFFGDQLRLRIILNNLVSNAIKYQNTEANRHQVKILIKADPDSARISVTDNGIGIEQKNIDNIFKLFFRTENTKSKDGTGIGLYIVKESIEKIGGNIQVTSTPMEGTTFEFVIPNRKRAA
jgi:two-component system, sensor histidine kinase and response regulator